MKTAEVRKAYLSFFEERGHRVVPSSKLVPANDPTLLFTNSGMVQFKDALLGREDLGYDRATSSQRCVRAGGKHNDLENVGYTARHHTFFEMLGNFSFGAYFKNETIGWAWEFTTSVLKLDPERIWVTVHPTDDESRRIWEDDIGVPHERVISLEENFWAMGDTGPCGPCTELFYDHGPEVEGGPPGSADEDGDRYIEFWNLVFPQFDRSPDGTLSPLPQPGVDTGMGLERVTAILQGVHSNYEIDLFQNLMLAVGQMAGINDPQETLHNASLCVIADHIRSSAFLIADGVMPGNEDRSYVLRRIIRRGLRHGYKLDINEPFFHKLVPVLVREMGDAFPMLREKQAELMAVLLKEEQRFAETLSQGMDLLEKTIAGLQGDVIPGDVAFRLYDTYGFPTDLTADVARERNLSVDMEGFDAAMEEQRSRGRAAARFDANIGQLVHADGKVRFTGYDGIEAVGRVVGLHTNFGKAAGGLEEGQTAIVVLDVTPFYAESGGQIGDTGELIADGVRFVVRDTQPSGDQFLHVGELVQGELSPGDELTARVDEVSRRRTQLNHSATHLLHAALRETLGAHVQQKGSLVAPERLRFDFSHPEPVCADELFAIEALVNAQVLSNTPVEAEVMAYDDAMNSGAMALFGEKYGDAVRVLTMGGGYSVELCGGTHVARTGDIGLLKILSETGVAAGVRRIEAVTGEGAHAYVSDLQQLVQRAADSVKSTPNDLAERVDQLVGEQRRLNKEIEQLNQRLAADQGGDLVGSAVEVDGIKVVAAEVQGDNQALMQTLDLLRSKLPTCVVLLAQQHNDKVNLVAGVSKDLTDRITAPDLINAAGEVLGARGGGRPDMARAGGGDPARLQEALAGVAEWVAARD
ncbi:MAG: alanine--tRNA ligase [Pseudomonadales bacterium]|jgi:alanyl-tRNA synthetase|nr:alanine--tRNA ligase [Pseudomonadales bacterium]MDP6471726.1 alanine--tRNA ligase [Pseudomonadales bacterium]MDP6971442.1 alanine--tRNA ligase [Pseudomonadales bacterium]